jgi:type II secretory pathway component PulK
VDDDGDGDWWELNKLPEIIEKMEKEKREQRERAELARVERNRSRWAIKTTELEKKDKEKEKEKEKEDSETEQEKKFRITAERPLHHQEWRDQKKHTLKILQRKAEPAFRFDATDSPLSSNMQEGELDYLSQPEADEESNCDNNNNN